MKYSIQFLPKIFSYVRSKFGKSGSYAAAWVMLLISGLFLGSGVYAANEPVNTRIQGSNLYAISGTSTTLDLSDNKFWLIENNLWQGEFEVQSVQNKITFGIDESDMVYHSSYYSRRITIDITYQELVNGSLVTSNINDIQLDINYDPAAHSSYKDRAVFNFTGGLDVQIEVQNIEYETSPGVWANANGIPEAVYLESEIITERYYAFNQNFAPDPNLNFSTANGELTVSWPWIEGAEEYELEWTWVNGYDGTVTSSNPNIETDLSQLSYNFNHNSTRVRLSGQNYYNIPLIYGEGYLLVRYRGIGRGGPNYQHRLEGSWSSDNLPGESAGLVSEYGTVNNQFVQTSGHEGDDINYGAGMSFIENGVRSVGVTYMDGVLKPRQSQAKLNTQDKIIVGSTIYDHHGRPAIGVMSSPVDQNSLGYVDDLNMYNGSTPYGKEHFDKDITLNDCDLRDAAPPMNDTNSTGAAYYYSELNTDVEGFNAYLPDADGYPFVQVQYSPDPTGRIKRVGGLGKDHQLGETYSTNDAHYTEYFYTTPDDNELWELFGNDAARPENYTKVVTKDVHGQLSVALIDGMGRTVATYLEGSAPVGLDEIEGNDGDDNQSKNFIPYNQDIGDGVLQVVTPIFVGDPTQVYTFNYDFTGTSFTDCLPVDVCFDCVYEVEITIMPAQQTAGEITDGATPTPATLSDADGIVQFTHTLGSLTSFDIDCGENALVFSTENPGDETFDLQFGCTGEYYITKTLKVSNAPIDYYWEQYVENSTCLLTYEDFLATALGNIDLTACDEYEPCEFNFLLEYGTESVWIANTGGTAQDYADLKADYLDDCGTLSSCESIKPLLLLDMTPGGQYGSTTTTDNLSVFNSTNNDLGGHWKSTGVVYYNQDGTQSYVCADNDGVFDDLPTDLTITEFFNAWQTSWAESLIQFHPEYCYYEFCIDYPEVADFEQDMMAIDTYSEACSSGYINPAETAGYFDLPACTTSVDDPIFETLYDNLSTSDKTAVDNIMNEEYDTYSIYEYAVEMAGDNSGSTTFGDGCNGDKHWENFRILYLSKRFQALEIVKENYVADSCTDASCVGDPACTTSPFKDATPRYFDWESVMGYDMSNLSSETWSSEADNMEAEVDTFCTTICDNQADIWMDQLAGCANDLPGTQTWNPGQPYYDSVRVNLVEVCANGCFGGCYGLTQFDTDVTSDTANSIYASFEDVLLHYLGSLSEDCTHLLINNPSTDEACHGDTTYLDKCACDALLAAESDTEEEFEALYGFVPVNFSAEQCECETYDANNNDTIDVSGSPSEEDNLDAAAIQTQNNYHFCSAVCLFCDDLTATTTGMVDQFNTDYSANYYDEPILFTAYVNDNYGSSFTYQELKELIDNCNDAGISGTEPIYNLLFDEVHYLKALLEKLHQEDISTDRLDYDHLELPEFFYTSLYQNCTGDPTTNDFDYDVSYPTGNELTFNLQGSNCSSCNVTIDLDGSLPVQYTDAAEFYSSIISFDEVYVIEDDFNLTGTPDWTTFRINVTVDDLSGGVENETLIISSCFDVVYQEWDPITRTIDFKLCDGHFEPVQGDPCMDNLITQAELSAEQLYEDYLEEQYDIFVQNYKETCSQVTNEEFYTTFQANRYHYTLLYYDQSGNLIKTVPPKGVDKLNSTEIDDAIDYANGVAMSTAQYNSHTFVTTYKHNTLNQVVEVTTPDGGTSNYWYDEIGRLVVSQNAKQENDWHTNIMVDDPTNPGTSVDAYSYTIYDELGRVKEVGEIIHADVMTYDIAKGLDAVSLSAWLDDDIATTNSQPVVKNNITQIYYDNLYDAGATSEFGSNYVEHTSRNRITCTSVISGYVETTGGQWVYPAPDYLNHYDYDVHGNVRSFLQEIEALDALNNQYRRTDYEYDLISGNPNYIWYQKGKTDQYIHHYKYDGDNRLKEVWTSDNGQVWDRDANYEYREDGYLARTELGEMKVQGMDYAYTLHGWLKSLNSGILEADFDMGKDGKTDPTVEYDNYENDIHALHARDAFSYTIGYYDGDYKAITDGDVGYTNHLIDIGSTSFETDIDELFNGNITSIISSTTDYDGNLQDPLATTYHYDQLHRFKESHVFTSANITDDQSIYYNSLDDASRVNTTGPGGLGEYEVHVEYDPNGNITYLNRMAHGANMDMDQFKYTYIDGTNKLDTLYDEAGYTGAGGFGDIISESEGSGDGIFYDYHSDGSLKADEEEEIAYIDWYPNGKIKRIYRTPSSTQSDVYFEYDPMGMRSLKVEITRTGTTINSSDDWIYTYYGCDANGITMAIYKLDKSANPDELERIENIIYGGSRLGMSVETETVSNAADYINDCNNDGLASAVIEVTDPASIVLIEVLLDDVSVGSDTWSTILTEEENVQNLTADINANAVDYYAFYYYDGSKYNIVIKELIAGAFQGDLVVEKGGTPTSPDWVKRQPGVGNCYDDRTLGEKFFELTNHLGNVMEVISDRKLAVGDGGSPTEMIAYFEPDVVNYSDYYPFGMEMPGRNGQISGADYRYSFQGMETDKEISGDGNSYTTQFRQYDPRLGRWKSRDPLAALFPSQSPYCAMDNNPISLSDPLGLQAENPKKAKAQTNNNTSGSKPRNQTNKKTSESPRPANNKDGGFQPDLIGSSGTVGDGEDAQYGGGDQPFRSPLHRKGESSKLDDKIPRAQHQVNQQVRKTDSELESTLERGINNANSWVANPLPDDVTLPDEDVDKVLNKFYSKEGGVLTGLEGIEEAMSEQQSLINLVLDIREDFKDQMKLTNGDISELDLSGYDAPNFTSSKGIASIVGGTQQVDIYLKTIQYHGDYYLVTLEVWIWDDFGVSVEDLGDRGPLAKLGGGESALAAFYVLQHHRGYKPVINGFKFEITVAGSTK